MTPLRRFDRLRGRKRVVLGGLGLLVALLAGGAVAWAATSTVTVTASNPSCATDGGTATTCPTSYTVAAGHALTISSPATTATTTTTNTTPTTTATTTTTTQSSGSTRICADQGGPYSSGSHIWPGGNWSPYSCSSYWNTPLPTYSAAQLASGSSTEINYMNSSWAHNFTPVDFSNNPANDEPSNWQHPVYWAKSSDPTYTISAGCGGPPAASSCPTSVQIPSGAQAALGGDGHLSVIQPDGHTEVDFWQVSNSGPISGGGTITASAYGALDLRAQGCCGNSTAANEGLPAGQIRAQEMAAGVIAHALTVSERCSNGQYVPPATGSGSGGCSGAPPVGARLQLRMTPSQIASSSYPAWEKTVLTAMANYGIFVTDTGGSPMDLGFEPAIQYTAFGDTSNTMMTWLKTQGFSDPAELTISLPWSDFQVVSTCYAQGTC